MECIVCMNVFEDNIYSTYCGHLFCKKCSDQMIANSASCWTCSSPLTSAKVHRIYLPEGLKTQNERNGITKFELFKTLIGDYQEIKNKNYNEELLTLQQTIDTLTLRIVKYESLNNDLKKKLRDITDTMDQVQKKFDKYQNILDEHEKKQPKKRFTRSQL